MVATKRKVDFSDVKEGGVFKKRPKPDGDYEGKVTAVDDHTSKAGDEGWVLTVQIKGDNRSTYPIYLSPDTKQAWKLHKVFTAAGMTVPKKLLMVDPNKLLNKTIGVTLLQEEYEGRTQSNIDDYMPVGDIQPPDDPAMDDDEAYDEAPVRKTTRAKAKPAPVEEDEEVEEEELEDEPEPTPPPRKRARKAAPAPEPEDDEEVEEEEPAPAPRKRAAKAAVPAQRRRAASVVEDDEDDLELDEL